MGQGPHVSDDDSGECASVSARVRSIGEIRGAGEREREVGWAVAEWAEVDWAEARGMGHGKKEALTLFLGIFI